MLYRYHSLLILRNSIMFSVLMSLYFKEYPAYLKASLDSLFHQTLLPDEVVLVEDGPLSSELEQVVSDYSTRYPMLKVIPLPQNQGLGKALNEGLKYCSYELVARMDTDDIAKPMRFQKQVEVFEKHPEIDVCSAWIDEFEESVNNVISTRKLPEWHDDIALYAKSRNPINHPVVMFKKSAVMVAGSYQHFPLFEDYYLWVRMLMNGAKFYNIQESLLWFRFSPEMFKRRGGWGYAMKELKFQKTLRAMGFISTPHYLKNVVIRLITRIIPNSWRSFIYKNLLRR